MKIIIDDEVIKVIQRSKRKEVIIDFIPKKNVDLISLKQYGNEIHFEARTNKTVSKRSLLNGIGFSKREEVELNLNKIQIKNEFESYKVIIPYR